MCAKIFAPGGSSPVWPNSIEFVYLPPELRAVSLPKRPARLQPVDGSKQMPVPLPDGVSTVNSWLAPATSDVAQIRPAITVICNTNRRFFPTHLSLNRVYNESEITIDQLKTAMRKRPSQGYFLAKLPHTPSTR
jgi:hypothetical protein